MDHVHIRGDVLFVVCICVGLLLVAGIVENLFHQRNLNRIPVRILVNGTRGKTSVCRLIVAALNAQGIRTMGRTTGSEASVLLPDGGIEPFVRRRSARITEMIPFVRRCVQADVQCMVVECMALGAENQKTTARMLVRPTHVAITNSYVDHIVEMGETTEETVWTLAQSVPRGCELFALEEAYSELDCSFHQVAEKEYRIEDSQIPLHDSNISLTVAVCETLGVNEEQVLSAVPQVLPDIGLHKEFRGRNGAFFYPSFSVNDLHCMEENLLGAASEAKELSLIYNNRADREYRLPLMLQILKRHGALVSRVYCIGDYPRKVASYFKKRSGVPAIASCEDALHEMIDTYDEYNIFLGLGNIKGAGESLITFFTEKGER